MKISVALAAYKGERYLGEQLDSVLPQLPPDGEVFVSDDCPGGATEALVREYCRRDGRVHYLTGPGKGVCANFENALRACTGDVIFLADQDDVWLPGKVEKVMAEMEKGADVVLHDARVTDGALQVTEPSFFAVHGSRGGLLPNLIRNSFVGCCMAFRRDLLAFVLPFPQKLPMHDWLIALAAYKKGKKVVLLPEALLDWRRHGDNVTGGAKNSLLCRLKWRLQMVYYLLKI